MSKQSPLEVTAPANFSDVVAIRHGAEIILKSILIPGRLPSPTRSIRAGQTLANCITAGQGGLSISTRTCSGDPGPRSHSSDKFGNLAIFRPKPHSRRPSQIFV
jgi:hypothetical protein